MLLKGLLEYIEEELTSTKDVNWVFMILIVKVVFDLSKFHWYQQGDHLIC